MKTTRMTALLLCFLFLFGLLAGCGGNTGNTGSGNSTGSNAGSTDGSAAETPDTAGTDGIDPAPEDNGPIYNFAPGNYELDSEGYPTGFYTYPLPLSNTDEIFTVWTSTFSPQYLPEDGYQGLRFYQELQEQTGIHFEYDVVDGAQRSQNLAVLLASDSLHDIMTSVTLYTSHTQASLADDGYFVNIPDHFEYTPNYRYLCIEYDDLNLKATINGGLQGKSISMPLIEADAVFNMGYFIRGDWCEDLGIDPAQITTFDKLHDVLTQFKVQKDAIHPMTLISSIEPSPAMLLTGYNTALYIGTALPGAKVIDGQVQFTATTADDRDAMEMLAQWYRDGLIDPSFSSYPTIGDCMENVYSGETGLFCAAPNGVDGFNALIEDPDSYCAPIPRLAKQEGDAFKYGQYISRVSFGGWSVSAACENIPLALTFCDWTYSPDGSFYVTFGCEGEVWNYNTDGEVELTDFVLNFEQGLIFATCLYAMNRLSEGGLFWQRRDFCYPRGRELWAITEFWAQPDYKGEYDFPTSLTFTDEEQSELSSISADLVTYMSETYHMFITGERSMSEWDTFVGELDAMGLARCREIYQQAYDTFMAAFA